MLIKKDDKSNIKYERYLGTIPLPRNRFYKYRIRQRLRRKYLFGALLTEDEILVTIEVPVHIEPNYTLLITEVNAVGKVLKEIELVCGSKREDAIRCYKILCNCGDVSFSQM